MFSLGDKAANLRGGAGDKELGENYKIQTKFKSFLLNFCSFHPRNVSTAKQTTKTTRQACLIAKPLLCLLHDGMQVARMMGVQIGGKKAFPLLCGLETAGVARGVPKRTQGANLIVNAPSGYLCSKQCYPFTPAFLAHTDIMQRRNLGIPKQEFNTNLAGCLPRLQGLIS